MIFLILLTKKMNKYTSAIPYSNFTNEYLLFILNNILNKKTTKDFNDLIKSIITIYYNTTYIFDKDTEIIEDDMFKNCSNLENLIIPDTIISIGSYAFYRCINLKTVNIPINVEYIDKCSFFNCKNLKEIYIDKQIYLSLLHDGDYFVGDCAFTKHAKIILY